MPATRPRPTLPILPSLVEHPRPATDAEVRAVQMALASIARVADTLSDDEAVSLLTACSEALAGHAARRRG